MFGDIYTTVAGYDVWPIGVAYSYIYLYSRSLIFKIYWLVRDIVGYLLLQKKW